MTTTTVTSTNTLKYDPDRAREGSRAFTRLYNNDGTDRELCDAWNSFTNNKTNREQRDRYMADSTFMDYYLKALYAKTVPSKRKALFTFLEFMKTYTLPDIYQEPDIPKVESKKPSVEYKPLRYIDHYKSDPRIINFFSMACDTLVHGEMLVMALGTPYSTPDDADHYLTSFTDNVNKAMRILTESVDAGLLTRGDFKPSNQQRFFGINGRFGNEIKYPVERQGYSEMFSHSILFQYRGVKSKIQAHFGWPVPIIVKGDPSDKWDEVQELSKNEDRPFIYICHNGSKWAGQEPDDIPTLLSVLSHNRLDHDRSYITLNPCAAVQVGPGKYVDGERLYPHATVMSFSGAFENITHGFRIDTNHAPTCELLLEAFERQGIVMDEDDD